MKMAEFICPRKPYVIECTFQPSKVLKPLDLSYLNEVRVCLMFITGIEIAKTDTHALMLNAI